MSTIETKPVGHGTDARRAVRSGATLRTVLLLCGILASLLYVAMNVVVPMRWDGYSVTSQTVSELSAIGAPTRALWVRLGLVYTVLLAAFGLGIVASAGRNRRLRIAGWLLIASAATGLIWPPMHLRGTEATLTDALHVAVTIVWLTVTMLTIGFAAAGLGRRFRPYSIATLVVFVAFGILSGMDAPRVAANLPTPWIGVWERINIAAFMLWLAVLAVLLLQRRGAKGA